MVTPGEESRRRRPSSHLRGRGSEVAVAEKEQRQRQYLIKSSPVKAEW